MRQLPTRLLAGALVASSCALLAWASAATSDAVVVSPNAKPTPTRTTTYPWPTATRTTPAPTKTTSTPAPTKTTTAPQPTTTKTTTAPAPTATRTSTAPRPTLSTTTAPTQPAGTQTSITLTAPRSVVQGGIVPLSGRLTAATGAIVGGAVDLSCGPGTPMSVPVASTGSFTGFIEIPVTQAPGRVFCTARFAGGGGLAGSSRSVPVTVEQYRTPTPDPTQSEETPSPTPTQTVEEPTESATASPIASASAVAVGGTSTTNVPLLVLIVGGAVTSVLTVGGMAFTAARGRRINPDGWDSLIAPEADPITPPRRLAE